MIRGRGTSLSVERRESLAQVGHFVCDEGDVAQRGVVAGHTAFLRMNEGCPVVASKLCPRHPTPRWIGGGIGTRGGWSPQSVQQFEFAGRAQGAIAVDDIELAEQVVDMGLDGAEADEECVGDLLVGLPAGHALQYVQLTAR
ncbi:hypothetical protein D3C78_337300 [compost metagenome]